MRKSKSAYMNYVCPKCFHKLHECSCSYFPPWSLLFIDERIQDHVRILNEKGYVTNGGSNTAICFELDYPEIIFSTMPEGFKYNRAKKAVWHFYDANKGKKDFETEKTVALIKLLDWCRGLPVNPNQFKRG